MRNIIEDITERAGLMVSSTVSYEQAKPLAFKDITGADMAFPIDTVLFCCTAVDAEAIDAAKTFITNNGLTADDVRLCQDERTTQVIAKREVFSDV